MLPVETHWHPSCLCYWWHRVGMGKLFFCWMNWKSHSLLQPISLAVPILFWYFHECFLCSYSAVVRFIKGTWTKRERSVCPICTHYSIWRLTGNWGKTPHIFNFGTKWRMNFQLYAPAATSRERALTDHCMRLDRAHGQSGCPLAGNLIQG